MKVSIVDMMLRQLAARASANKPIDDIPFERYCESNLRIRDVNSQVIPFRLREIQRHYLKVKRDAVDRGKQRRFVLLKYRRGGFTTVEQALSYYTASRTRNVNVMTLAQEKEITERIFRIPKLMHERDPDAPEIKGTGNRHRLEFPNLNSIFFVATASGRSAGRGDTLTRVHWSEVAWSCPGFRQTTKQNQILSGLTEAASHGEVVLESTPNGYEKFHDIYKEGKLDPASPWTSIFLPWFVDSSNRRAVESRDEAAHVAENMSDDEKRLVRVHSLDVEQIKFRREKHAMLKGLAIQEYPEDDDTCFLTSGFCYFDRKFVADALGSLADYATTKVPGVEYREIPGGYLVRWAKQAIANDRYYIGADTSEGIPGADPSGYVVLDSAGRPVEAAHGYFSIAQQADLIFDAHHRWNRACAGVEREMTGLAVVTKLIDKGVFRKFHLLHDHHDKPGWSTNKATRPIMLASLADHAYAIPGFCIDKQLLSEMLTFNMVSQGRYEASGDNHDDCVMKYAVAVQTMRNAPRPPPGIREVEW